MAMMAASMLGWLMKTDPIPAETIAATARADTQRKVTSSVRPPQRLPGNQAEMIRRWIGSLDRLGRSLSLSSRSAAPRARVRVRESEGGTDTNRRITTHKEKSCGRPTAADRRTTAANDRRTAKPVKARAGPNRCLRHRLRLASRSEDIDQRAHRLPRKHRTAGARGETTGVLHDASGHGRHRPLLTPDYHSIWAFSTASSRET